MQPLRSQPEVDPSRLGLLGHSMGSGAVMSTGIRNQTAAATAVSPTGAAVTPQVPRNPTVAGGQLGSWLCHQQSGYWSGGENENLAEEQGRSLVIIPNAEHHHSLPGCQSPSSPQMA